MVFKDWDILLFDYLWPRFHLANYMVIMNNNYFAIPNLKYTEITLWVSGLMHL